MIVKVQKDKEKARMLIQMASITYQRLQSTDIQKYPSNTLIDYYDIIHGLMEALVSSQGFKIKGEGAHKVLIDHIAKSIPLKEKDRIFLQDLREYRNRISHEGFSVNAEYIRSNKERFDELIKELARQADLSLDI